MNEWKLIDPKDISYHISTDDYMYPCFVYKGITINISREFIEDIRANTNVISLENVILEQYNKNKGVIRERKIDQIIK